jgi:SAM-dependent methyltransferase
VSSFEAVDTAIRDGCVCCGPGQPFTEHRVEEGMFRTGEVFTYRECLRCGSLQIADVPDDLSRYYDADEYYSFKTTKLVTNRIFRTGLARAAFRANTSLFLRTGLGRPVQTWARMAGVKLSDRILDLGCGGGDRLFRMHLLGFRHLAGADPFLPEDREVASSVPLRKQRHDEIDGRYDWIMMHHTFEHVPDPRATLQSCKRLLSEGGKVLIRIPIMGQAAWRRYGTNWVQIDPPRHLVVYTPRSVKEIAESEGFRVDQIFYDSTGFQFWGSECVAARQPHSRGPHIFTENLWSSWNLEADRLNKAHDGDQAGFVLSAA